MEIRLGDYKYLTDYRAEVTIQCELWKKVALIESFCAWHCHLKPQNVRGSWIGISPFHACASLRSVAHTRQLSDSAGLACVDKIMASVTLRWQLRSRADLRFSLWFPLSPSSVWKAVGTESCPKPCDIYLLEGFCQSQQLWAPDPKNMYSI